MADAILPTEKPCSRCKRSLPLAEFSPDSRTKLGVGSQCKACNRGRMKGYTAAHKPQIAEKNRKYRETHKAELNQRAADWWDRHKDEANRRRREQYPDKRERLIADQRKYRAEHAGYIRLRQKRYYQANRAEHRARLRKWRAENPELFKAQLKRRRARLAGAAVVTLTADEWAMIQAAYDHRCAYCGVRPDVLTQDHIRPLSKGGTHEASNVVPACQSCNSSKGDREL